MNKLGRNGEFLACSKYPELGSTRNFRREDQGKIIALEKEQILTDETCEKCGKPMQVRFGRYGKFLGCSGYPECTTQVWGLYEYGEHKQTEPKQLQRKMDDVPILPLGAHLRPIWRWGSSAPL